MSPGKDQLLWMHGMIGTDHRWILVGKNRLVCGFGPKMRQNLQHPNILKFQKGWSIRKKRLASQLAPWPHALGSGSKQGSRHLNFTQACKKLRGLYFEQKCYSNWLFWKTLNTTPDSGCNRHAWYTQCNTWWNHLQGNLEGTCMWLGYSWPRIKRSHHKLHPCSQAGLVNNSFFNVFGKKILLIFLNAWRAN